MQSILDVFSFVILIPRLDTTESLSLSLNALRACSTLAFPPVFSLYFVLDYYHNSSHATTHFCWHSEKSSTTKTMVSLPPILFFAIAAVLVQLESTNARLSTSPRRRVRADDVPSDLSMPSSVSFIDGQDEPELLPTSREVCIAGGGPSGVYAAHLLQEKGYSVALFEKASMIGGKTVPIKDGVKMFRHVLTKDMTLVQSLVEKFGLEGELITRNNENVCSDEEPYICEAVTRQSMWENLALGLNRPGVEMESIAMAAAAARYIDIWNSYEEVILQPNHDGVPEELMKGASQWLEENGIQAIAKFHGL